MHVLKASILVLALATTMGMFSALDAQQPGQAATTPASTATAADARQWPQYRGPNHDGASTEPAKWPATAPRKLWEIDLAKGYGSLSIHDGRVYIMGTPGKGSDLSRAVTYCLDAATGKVLWEHTIEKVAEVIGATPSIADGHVVSAGPGGEIVCLDAGSGKPFWEVRMGLKNTPYCYGCSPMIHKGRVIVLAGPSIRAFDLADGKELWKTDWAIPAGGGRWTSPALGVFDGKETAVCLSRSNLVGLDPADGKVLWKLDLEANPVGEDLVNTPIITGNRIICLAYRLAGARSTRLISVEIKDGKAREVWKSEGRSGNRGQSPVIWDDCVYLPSDTLPAKVARDGKGQLNCYDLQTGKLLWTSQAPQAKGPPGGKDIWNDGGAFMIAGGKLLLLDGTGHISMADVSANGCTVLGDMDFDAGQKAPGGDPKDRGPAQSGFLYLTPPVFLNGRLYVRNHQKLACYDLRE